MPDYHYLIPDQQQGLEKNLEYTVVCDTTEDAEDFFVDAKERLMDINNWNRYGRIEGVVFRLRDSHGKEAHRHARKGDSIRVDIPVNGPGESGGFDWVAIEAIEYDDYPDLGLETFGMRLHPSLNPMNAQAGNGAYAPGDNATGTFVILRRGNKLISTYHGRNDHRQAETNMGGRAWPGLTDMQWASLISGIAEPGMVRR